MATFPQLLDRSSRKKRLTLIKEQEDGEQVIIIIVIIIINDMVGECSPYGGGERRVQGFGGET
jgi:hypothetical protein